MHTRSADVQAAKETKLAAVKDGGKADGSGEQADAEDTGKQVKEGAEAEEEAETEHDLADADHAESLRRKRDREGSLEPSLTPSKQESIPTKKNRLQSDLVAEDPTSAVSSSPPLPSSAVGSFEGEKVGQIRKRVEDLSWKQRKEGDRDKLEPDADAAAEDTGKEESTDAVAIPSVSEDPAAKSSQPTFASFSKSKGFAGASAGPANALGGTPSRTQPTFSSFSKSSSPFGSASASIAGPSWLAGKSNASTAGGGSGSGYGGLKPSNLGSMPGSSGGGHDSPSASMASKSVSPPPSSVAPGGTGKGLGFGAFASNNPFGGSAGRSSTPSSGTANTTSGEESNSNGLDAGASASAPAKSFDEALREGKMEKGDQAKGNKVETQFDKGQADLRTGEEEDVTLASIRAKLFTMSDDKSWKERGTGTVRCNVERQAYERGRQIVGARLVMRSEGVLRLILNVKLFKGMKVNLEQDKFLRMVAFEDGKATHFAIRMGNAVAASQFTQTIQSLITKGESNGGEDAGEEA